MQIRKAEYTHIGGRRANQDALWCNIRDSRNAVAIVCDGLERNGRGSLAAQIAVKHLSEAIYCDQLPGRELITGFLRRANQELQIYRTDAVRMKTSVVFLAIRDASAVWAHIGNARLYHFYNGELTDYTKDHTAAQLQVEAGELRRDQIGQSPDRSRIIRLLGNEDLNPTIREPVFLDRGRHAFLLCTDGFWEGVPEDEIRMDLRKSATPEEWLMYLRGRRDLRIRADEDNNTAVAIFVEI